MKIFSRFLLFAVCSVLFSLSSIGQNFSISPTNSIDKTHPLNREAADTLHLINNTTGALQFQWRKINETFDSDWTYSLCDLGMCYSHNNAVDLPDTATMNATSPGGDAYFLTHVDFEGIPGSGELKLYVYEVGDEANGDTVTFRYTASAAAGIEDHAFSANTISTYPNPAKDILTINTQNDNEELSAVEVLDNKGRVIYKKAERFGSSYSIPVANFPMGYYIIKVQNTKGTTVYKRFTIER